MARTETRKPRGDVWPAGLEDEVRRRLREELRIRRRLPKQGRIHIDRPLPFLCVYRRPVGETLRDAERLVASEASYVIGSGRLRDHRGLTALVQATAAELVEEFGACLILEVWEAPMLPADEETPGAALKPGFRIVATRGASQDSVTNSLESSLARVRLGKSTARVVKTWAGKACAEAMRPLMTAAAAKRLGCLVYGLEIAPVYRSPVSGDVFPGVLRQLRRGLSIALRRVFFDFARAHTTHRPAHYHALGRRAVVKAVWQVDAILADACEQFDFLLQISPVNTEQAWRDFKRHKYDRTPTFHYRPIPADPMELKRRLYKAPVERIEDPALGMVFREKVYEVDRQITMLQDMGTPRCLSESLQLYGGVEEGLRQEALTILETIPPRSSERAPKACVGPEQVAQLARQEVKRLATQDPSLAPAIEIRDDVAGLLVSQGNLLIGADLRVPQSRLAALVQHEVGTHIVTYHNGRQQPFRQLYTGLAGYDELQEGIAVLSEYLVGGLSRPRIRVLAARVLAVDCLLDGASFVETYRVLVDRYGLQTRTAFSVTTRVFRGGGFTKDAIYLRGVQQAFEFLRQNGDLKELLVGKIGIGHVPIVRELRLRGILKAPAILPGYMTNPETDTKLEQLRQMTSLLDLVKRGRR